MKKLWLLAVLLAVLSACGGGDGDKADSLPFKDDLQTPGNWHTTSDPEVEIAYQDGGLGIKVKVLDRVAWTMAGRRYKDFAVDVDAAQIGGPDDNSFGLVVRYKDDKHFYRFEISGDGYYGIHARDGLEWIPIVNWTESQVINQGQASNHLRVECLGSSFSFYVNGQLVEQATDDRYAEGDVGLVAVTLFNKAGTHILFKDFAITELPAP